MSQPTNIAIALRDWLFGSVPRPQELIASIFHVITWTGLLVLLYPLHGDSKPIQETLNPLLYILALYPTILFSQIAYVPIRRLSRCIAAKLNSDDGVTLTEMIFWSLMLTLQLWIFIQIAIATLEYITVFAEAFEMLAELESSKVNTVLSSIKDLLDAGAMNK